jgi:hypothetical protein
MGTSFMACHFLIPRFGLRGAALAALVAMCVQLLGTALVIHSALVKRAQATQPALGMTGEPALESQ